jgi:pimeloyl-ACP methyl ester carboxylesterase
MNDEPVVCLGDLPRLDERFRVLVPEQPPLDADALAAFLAQVADGPVHVVAEASLAGVACWLALRSPHLVRRLVLARPACLTQDLVQRLSEIHAETLVVLDSGVPPGAGQVYQERMPRAWRFFVYAPSRLASLIADFLLRGERFVVNTEETRSW